MTARVLIIGQGIKPTGYGRVSSSLLPRLASAYETHLFAINYRGPALEGDWTVHPNRVPGDNLGVEQLPALLNELRPDVVLIIHDWHLYVDHAPALMDAPKRPKTMLYCPVDGVAVDRRVVRGVSTVDRLVLFTEFARCVIVAGYAGACADGDGLVMPPIAVIPHGVDSSSFRPLGGASSPECRARARQICFPMQDLEGSFVVLNGNRNVPRKRVDISVEAFALFAADKPDARLCLHMGLRDMGYDLVKLVRTFGIEDKVILTTRSEWQPDVSDRDLNVLYNACDVGLNTSTGEGWGLVAFEHAATGGAQIMPRHSVCEELWRGAAWLVAPFTTFRHPQDVVEHALVRPSDVATALEELYCDGALLCRYAAAAYERARSPELNWDNIAARWYREIAATLAGQQP
jgi:glycosyltransferase involved in cell wall biosynthesis